MRIFMQTPPVPGELLRFVQLQLQEDLLGGWSLIREAGVQGARGRVTRDWFEQHEDAMDALIEQRDRQLRKGYRVVYREGA